MLIQLVILVLMSIGLATINGLGTFSGFALSCLRIRPLQCYAFYITHCEYNMLIQLTI